MLITVDWSGVFHAILQIPWQICLLTHHCVGRVANKKWPITGSLVWVTYILWSLHVFHDTSNFKPWTIIQHLRWSDALKSSNFHRGAPSRGLNLHSIFAHFSDDFPSNIQPNVCVWFTRWRLVHWNLRGPGIGKGEQTWYETLKPMEFSRVQAIKMDENGNGYLYIYIYIIPTMVVCSQTWNSWAFPSFSS